jgi:hypothetical protein
MSQLLAFMTCVLGSKALLDVWFKGSIFAWHRAWAELIRDEGKWWLSRKLGELLTCRFCFSYHSSLWLSLCCLPILSLWMLPPWWLAVRTATWFLDLFEDRLEKGNSINEQHTDASRANDGTHGHGSEASFFD